MIRNELLAALLVPCRRWKRCKDVRYAALDYIEALEGIIRTHADPTGDDQQTHDLIMGCHDE